MAGTLQSNGSITFAVTPLQVVGDMTLTYFITGSNLSANIQDIAVGSWQGVNTSSLSDIRYVYASNDGSGSVQIATDAAGTKVMAILQTGDFAFLPWSGSTGLYARAFDSASVLTTIIAET